MISRIPTKGADECDALSRRAKNYLNWAPGRRKARKRSYNKRVRKVGKEDLRRVAE